MSDTLKAAIERQHRNGPCGKFPVDWHPTYVTFRDKPREKFLPGTNEDLAHWNDHDREPEFH